MPLEKHSRGRDGKLSKTSCRQYFHTLPPQTVKLYVAAFSNSISENIPEIVKLRFHLVPNAGGIKALIIKGTVIAVKHKTAIF